MNTAIPTTGPTANRTANLSPEPRRSFRQVLLSYLYWTYSRGSFHYDVMVTLILLFIFATPQIWSYGDKPSTIVAPAHPVQVTEVDGHGLMVAMQATDVTIPSGSTEKQVRQLLRRTIEPVTGGEVTVDRWDTVSDAEGNLTWRVWAHR